MKTNKTRRAVRFVVALTIAAAILMPYVQCFTASAAASTGAKRFKDVPDGAWYATAVNAMADAGVVNGYEDGTFRPNQPMTAGEYATVLWNMMYGDWCKATELRATFTNGYAPALNDFLNGNYSGPGYGNWGTPLKYPDGTSYGMGLLPTTWDGSVSLVVYGDSRRDPANSSNPESPARSRILLGGCAGRLAGKTYGTGNSSKWQGDEKFYSRDMSGLAIVAMSKEYVTRGFAISELVNVLRQTGNLESIYKASISKNTYAAGASIPDWAAVTDKYHDACSASVKDSGNSWINKTGKYLFHDYTWAWNYSKRHK